jgi:hypothetical protein
MIPPVAIPIIVAGVLYWIFKPQPKSDVELAEEKRELRRKMKVVSKEQQKRAQKHQDVEEES